MNAKATIIKERIDDAFEILKSCRLCGHGCGVDRIAGDRGIGESRNGNRGIRASGKCRAGEETLISAHTAHYGEEPCISGAKGSGTIFFTGCNLACVFCQNWEISQGAWCGVQGDSRGNKISGRKISERELADIMLELQKQGCHNINLVSPTHYMPQVLIALKTAYENGLNIPLVYNSNGYDSVELLKLLDGIVDIYMPDLKYFDDEKAVKYSNAENYTAVSKSAIREMFRQVGNLRMDINDIAKRGLLVRHLVLPEGLSQSKQVLKLLSTVSKDLWISIMSQYSPQYRAGEFNELNRRITPEEYWDVVGYAQELGLENFLIQEMGSAENYLPDFKKEQPFE